MALKNIIKKIFLFSLGKAKKIDSIKPVTPIPAPPVKPKSKGEVK